MPIPTQANNNKKIPSNPFKVPTSLPDDLLDNKGKGPVAAGKPQTGSTAAANIVKAQNNAAENKNQSSTASVKNQSGTAPVKNQTGSTPVKKQTGTTPTKNQISTAPAKNQTGSTPVKKQTGSFIDIGSHWSSVGTNTASAAMAVKNAMDYKSFNALQAKLPYIAATNVPTAKSSARSNGTQKATTAGPVKTAKKVFEEATSFGPFVSEQTIKAFADAINIAGKRNQSSSGVDARAQLNQMYDKIKNNINQKGVRVKLRQLEDMMQGSKSSGEDREIHSLNGYTVRPSAVENNPVRKATLKDLTVNSFSRGRLNTTYGQESFKSMMGDKNNKEKYENLLKDDKYNFEPDGAFQKAVSGASELLGQISKQYTDPKVLSAGLAAAGGTALAGNAGPQAIIPEEIVTVPGAFIIGTQLGGAEQTLEIESGLAYNEMIENGVTPDTAKKIALAVGGGNALLELVQADDLVKSFKILNKGAAKSTGFTKKLKNYLIERGLHVGNEALQEVAQEGVTITGVNAANKIDNGKWAYGRRDVVNRLLETGESSLLSFALMGATGDAVKGGVNHVSSVGANKAASPFNGQRQNKDIIYNKAADTGISHNPETTMEAYAQRFKKIGVNDEGLINRLLNEDEEKLTELSKSKNKTASEAAKIALEYKAEEIQSGKNANGVFTNDGNRDIINNRGMAMGLRQPASRILTDVEIEAVKAEADILGISHEMLLFNTGEGTSYFDDSEKIHICGDILPDSTSIGARDRMSIRAVLAHEYYGHHLNRDNQEQYRIGDWRDEYRASRDAAINAPGLTDEDRALLMVDAYDRAREAGQILEYDDIARRIIYGY